MLLEKFLRYTFLILILSIFSFLIGNNAKAIQKSPGININKIIPGSGSAGKEITIYASGIDTTAELNVFFGDYESDVTKINPTNIKAIVPSGIYGKVTIATFQNSFKSTARKNFTILKNEPVSFVHSGVTLFDTMFITDIGTYDFNRDNEIDFLVHTEDEYFFYLKEKGSLSWKRINLLDSEPAYLSIADLNQDNLDDIIFIEKESGHLKWSKGLDKLKFDTPVLITDSLENTKKFILEDLNNDGIPEILINNEKNHHILIINHRHDSFEVVSSIDWNINDNSGYQLRNFILSDVNSDGLFDLVMLDRYDCNCHASPPSTHFQYALNDSALAFGEVIQFWASTTSNSLYSIDIDNDGDFDILTQDVGKIYWLENQDGFVPYSELTDWNFRKRIGNNSQISNIIVNDLNGDNKLDVMDYSGNYYTESIQWYENIESGLNWKTHALDQITITDRFYSILEDLDNDGKVRPIIFNEWLSIFL